MIFFCDNSGLIFKTVPEKIYQGSVNSNTIYLVGAFDGDCAVTVRFELPNGLLTTEKLLTSSYTALNGDIQTENGISYNVWEYVLKSDITSLSGTVGVQFTVTSQNGNGMAATVCTARSTFDVEKGVPFLQDDSAINYETLLTQIKAVLTALQQGDTENSIASAASAEAARISAENAAESEQQALAAQESAQESAESAAQSEAIISGMAAQIQGYIKQTEQNTLNITNIQAVLQGNSQYAEITVSEAYTSRFTANGANIFDGQLTPVESIKGSTVRCKNLFDISKITTSVYDDGSAGVRNNDDGTLTVGPAYFQNPGITLKTICPALKVGDVVTFSFKTQSHTSVFIACNGAWYSGTSRTITQEMLDAPIGFYGYHPNDGDKFNTLCIISDIQIEYGTVATDYQPYFTGLKNANINSIVSTGKNLFNKAAAEKISNWDFSQVYQKFKLFTFKKEKTYTISIEEMNAARSNHTNISGYDFILTVSSTSGVGGGAEVLGVASSAVYDGTNKIYRISANDTTDKYLWIYIPNSSFYNDEWLEYVFTNIVKGMMISEGTQEIPYEPYIEHKYQLPQTVELAEFDIISPPEQTLTRYTETIVFETTSDYWEMTSSGIFKYTGYFSETPDITQTGGFGVCNLFDPVSSQNPNGSCGIGADGYFVVIKQDINSLEAFLSYLQTQETNGNPLTLAYKTAEPVSTTIFAASEAYEVYNGGTETIVQGTTDNSEYGAKPTITQTYLGKVGE